MRTLAVCLALQRRACYLGIWPMLLSTFSKQNAVSRYNSPFYCQKACYHLWFWCSSRLSRMGLEEEMMVTPLSGDERWEVAGKTFMEAAAEVRML